MCTQSGLEEKKKKAGTQDQSKGGHDASRDELCKKIKSNAIACNTGEVLYIYSTFKKKKSKCVSFYLFFNMKWVWSKQKF